MATLTQISQALNDLLPKLKPLSMPTGMLGHFYSVPDGWLLCNGAAVSRHTQRFSQLLVQNMAVVMEVQLLTCQI